VSNIQRIIRSVALVTSLGVWEWVQNELHIIPLQTEIIYPTQWYRVEQSGIKTLSHLSLRTIYETDKGLHSTAHRVRNNETASLL
jgi:hypothetical protein